MRRQARTRSRPDAEIGGGKVSSVPPMTILQRIRPRAAPQIRIERVGWVERSETHDLSARPAMDSQWLNSSYALLRFLDCIVGTGPKANGIVFAVLRAVDDGASDNVPQRVFARREA